MLFSMSNDLRDFGLKPVSHTYSPNFDRAMMRECAVRARALCLSKLEISYWLNKMANAALEYLQLCTWLLTNSSSNNNVFVTGNAPKTRERRVLKATSFFFLKAAPKATTSSEEHYQQQQQQQGVLHQLLGMLGQTQRRLSGRQTVGQTDRQDCHINAI